MWIKFKVVSRDNDVWLEETGIFISGILLHVFYAIFFNHLLKRVGFRSTLQRDYRLFIT